jgi:hypothetical protein
MRLTDHTFVTLYTMPMDFLVCRHCGQPDQFCTCNPEDEDLPDYVGCDPTLYAKEAH